MEDSLVHVENEMETEWTNSPQSDHNKNKFKSFFLPDSDDVYGTITDVNKTNGHIVVSIRTESQETFTELIPSNRISTLVGLSSADNSRDIYGAEIPVIKKRKSYRIDYSNNTVRRLLFKYGFIISSGSWGRIFNYYNTDTVFTGKIYTILLTISLGILLYSAITSLSLLFGFTIFALVSILTTMHYRSQKSV